MSIELEWHAALPVLLTTYSGTLTLKEYHAMVAKRRAMLDAGPGQVVVIADVHLFEAFPDAEQARGASVITDDRVTYTLLVLPPRLMNMVLRNAPPPANPAHPVHFCRDVDAALDLAQRIVAN